MTEEDEPQQITILKRMLALNRKQMELAELRTRMSADRSRMSEDRSRMSEDRSRMSEERSKMSADRSRMSAQRSEMSEVRSYHNAERTLAVWVRTALSLMVFGIAIDRFGLLLHQIPGGKDSAQLQQNALLAAMSDWTGAALVLLAVVMALTTGLRFLAFARVWLDQHTPPAHHGPYLATFFALMVAAFGSLLLVFMLVFAS